MRRYATLFGFALLCACGSSSSDGGTEGEPCVAGESIECAGPGGCVGYQVCEADGESYGACMCGSVDAGGALDAAGDATRAGDGTAGDTSAPPDGTVVGDGAGAQDTGAADATVGDGSENDAISSIDGSLAVDSAITPDASAADASIDVSSSDGSADASPDAAPGDGGNGIVANLCTTTTCSAGQTACGSFCYETTSPLFCCTPCTDPEQANTKNAQMTCAANTCVIATCWPGFADCNGDPGDGCEADLTNPTTCGSCGVQCGGSAALCSPNGCVAACAPPLTTCGTSCVDLTSSSEHCGTCTNNNCEAADNGGGTCVGAVCKWQDGCAPGTSLCENYCVDTTSDPANCGGCGQVCPTVTNGTMGCVASVCVPACQPGWTYSGGSCVAPQISPIWIATGLPEVLNLALDGANLYWVDGTSNVLSMPTAGGPVVTLAQGQAKPVGLAVDADSVYWGNNLGGAVMKTLKDGSGTPVVVSPATSPRNVGLGPTDVYWIDESANVWMAPTTGTSSPSIALTLPRAPPNQLIGGPLGLFVWELTTSNIGTVYNVLTHAVTGTGGPPLSDAILDSSGTGLIFTVSYSLESCELDFDVYQSPCMGLSPVLQNSCGLFFSQAGGTWLYQGYEYSALIFTDSAGEAVADSDYMYFTTGNAIGKWPLH